MGTGRLAVNWNYFNWFIAVNLEVWGLACVFTVYCNIEENAEQFTGVDVDQFNMLMFLVTGIE